MASVIEQNNDEAGIIFPKEIAPYQVSVVAINSKDENVMVYSEELYKRLNENRIDVLYDNRDERPGVKFKDMDLIGIPIRVEIGARDLENNQVTLVRRDTLEKIAINKDINNVLEEINNLYKKLK